MEKIKHHYSLLGLVVWLFGVAYQKPQYLHQSWAEALLAFAVLVLSPLAISLYAQLSKHGKPADQIQFGWVPIAQDWAFPAGLLFAFSYTLSQGGFAAVLTLPWMLVSFFIALDGTFLLKNALKNRTDTAFLPQFAASMAALFFPVGTVWALMDRAGLQPFGYDAAIVLLTAVQFHFAGLFFPLLLAALVRFQKNQMSRLSVWLFVFGVPLTAVGISVGQFFKNYILEAIAGSVVVSGVLLTTVNQVFFAFKSKMPLFPKFGLLLSSFCFLFAMALAACYANRVWLAWEWFSIPNLRFWHGTANALAISLGLMVLAKNDAFL